MTQQGVKIIVFASFLIIYSAWSFVLSLFYLGSLDIPKTDWSNWFLWYARVNTVFFISVLVVLLVHWYISLPSGVGK